MQIYTQPSNKTYISICYIQAKVSYKKFNFKINSYNLNDRFACNKLACK